MTVTIRRDVVKALLLSAAAALLSAAVLGAIVLARLRPTYVCAVVNGIVASIAASSKMDGRWGKVSVVTADAGGADVTGKGEEMKKGVLEARPYEEVVEEVMSGNAPGACRVALPFGEVLDVGEDGGYHQPLELACLGGKDGEEKPPTARPKEEISNSSCTELEQRKLRRILRAQQDFLEEEEEEDLNRRVERFIDKFNQLMRSEKSGALQVL